MFVADSIFKATSPQPPSVVNIGYSLLLAPTIPDGAEVEVITQDDGEITININL